MSEDDEDGASSDRGSSLAYRKFVSNKDDFEEMIAFGIYTSLENEFCSKRTQPRSASSKKFEEMLTDSFVEYIKRTAHEKVNGYASSIIMDTERDMSTTIVKNLPGRWRAFCQGVSASVIGTLLIGIGFTAAMHMPWLNPFVPIIETARDIVDQRDFASSNVAKRNHEDPFSVEPAAGPPKPFQLEACQKALSKQMICFDKRDLGLVPLSDPKTR